MPQDQNPYSSRNETVGSGRAMFQMLGVFAEFERAMIRERVMRVSTVPALCSGPTFAGFGQESTVRSEHRWSPCRKLRFEHIRCLRGAATISAARGRPARISDQAFARASPTNSRGKRTEGNRESWNLVGLPSYHGRQERQTQESLTGSSTDEWPRGPPTLLHAPRARWPFAIGGLEGSLGAVGRISRCGDICSRS
jgi:hypothetical protein